MGISVSLESAYAEACRALGEKTVEARLLEHALESAQAQLQSETDTLEPGGPLPAAPVDGSGDPASNGHGDISRGTDETKLTEVKGDANANENVKQGGHQKN